MQGCFLEEDGRITITCLATRILVFIIDAATNQKKSGAAIAGEVEDHFR